MAAFATFAELKQDTLSRMDKAVEVLKKDFSGLRTGRASTALLDGLMVEAYGAMTPLVQIGTVSVPESRMLSVQVWDRSMVKSVEKAIRDAGLGLNPMNDGQVIRIPIPPMREDRRQADQGAFRRIEGRRAQHPPRRHGCRPQNAEGRRYFRRRSEKI